MIRTFKHRGLKKLYSESDATRVLQQYSGRIRRILTVLDAASTIDGIALPGFRLHPLKGDRKGLWSVTVSGNWRVVFRFEGGDVFDVDLVDYH